MLAEGGYYSDTLFHRSIRSFMIQACSAPPLHAWLWRLRLHDTRMGLAPTLHAVFPTHWVANIGYVLTVSIERRPCGSSTCLGPAAVHA